MRAILTNKFAIFIVSAIVILGMLRLNLDNRPSQYWSNWNAEISCPQRGSVSANYHTYGIRDVALPHVMVLGSGGLVGSALAAKLREKGYNVIEIKGRQHIDLRDPNALDFFDTVNVQFVYFLACEVGGSKFLAMPGVQEAVWDSNMQMYDVVLEWLRRRNIKFVFSTSQLSNQPTNYGKIKKKGEDLVNAMTNGKMVMFWNVYGPEDVGLKSHVISDWVSSCITKGSVQSLTNGAEFRQYLYTEDCSDGLIAMMEHFDAIEKTVHLTTGTWHSLKDVAQELKQVLPSCRVGFTNTPANNSRGQEPNLKTVFHSKWKPQLTLQDGIRKTYEYYLALYQTYTSHQQPYISIILYDDGDASTLQKDVNNWVLHFTKFNASVYNFVELLVAYPAANNGTVKPLPLPAWVKIIPLLEKDYDATSAINLALSVSKGQYIMLLNTKTRPTEMLIENLKRRKLRAEAYYLAEYFEVNSHEEAEHIMVPFKGRYQGRRVKHQYMDCMCAAEDTGTLSSAFLLTHKDNLLSIGGYPNYPGVWGHIAATSKLVYVFPGLDQVVLEPKVYRIASNEDNEKPQSAKEVQERGSQIRKQFCCKDHRTLYNGWGDSMERWTVRETLQHNDIEAIQEIKYKHAEEVQLHLEQDIQKLSGEAQGKQQQIEQLQKQIEKLTTEHQKEKETLQQQMQNLKTGNNTKFPSLIKPKTVQVITVVHAGLISGNERQG